MVFGIKEITLKKITKKVLAEMETRTKDNLPNYICLKCQNVSIDKFNWYIIPDMAPGVRYTTDVCPKCSTEYKKD